MMPEDVIKTDEYFVCNGCLETFTDFDQLWDQAKGLCKLCSVQKHAPFCPTCKKNKPHKDYWGQCESCFLEETKKLKEQDKVIRKNSRR